MNFEQLKEYLNQREGLLPKSCWDKAKEQKKEQD